MFFSLFVFRKKAERMKQAKFFVVDCSGNLVHVHVVAFEEQTIFGIFVIFENDVI